MLGIVSIVYNIMLLYMYCLNGIYFYLKFIIREERELIFVIQFLCLVIVFFKSLVFFCLDREGFIIFFENFKDLMEYDLMVFVLLS